jgi:hypothetical protein
MSHKKEMNAITFPSRERENAESRKDIKEESQGFSLFSTRCVFETRMASSQCYLITVTHLPINPIFHGRRITRKQRVMLTRTLMRAIHKRDNFLYEALKEERK